MLKIKFQNVLGNGVAMQIIEQSEEWYKIGTDPGLGRVVSIGTPALCAETIYLRGSQATDDEKIRFMQHSNPDEYITKAIGWLHEVAEAMMPEPELEPGVCANDVMVEVSLNGKEWHRRYLLMVTDYGGCYSWDNGRTGREHGFCFNACYWDYVRTIRQPVKMDIVKEGNITTVMIEN